MITHYVWTDRSKNYATDRMVLVAEIGTHRVVFVEGPGTDYITINGTEFADRSTDDMFASELFGDLTGSFPYQVEETIPAKRITPAQAAVLALAKPLPQS